MPIKLQFIYVIMTLMALKKFWSQTTGKKPNMTDSFLYHTQLLLRYHLH